MLVGIHEGDARKSDVPVVVVVLAVVVVVVVLEDHPLALSEDQAGDATAKALRPRRTMDLYIVILVWVFFVW